MKLVSALILMISIMFSGPNVCAHAIGVDEVPSTQSSHASHDMSAHAEMGHDMTQDHNNMSTDHSNHCEDGCDGGEDCNGCSAVSSAIVSSGFFGPNALPTLDLAWVSAQSLQTLMHLDPPPPKVLFLI